MKTWRIAIDASLVILGFLLIVGLGLASAGEVFKWTDKNGTMIFSESPPPSGGFEKLILDAEKKGPSSIAEKPDRINRTVEPLEKSSTSTKPEVISVPSVEPTTPAASTRDMRTLCEQYITQQEANDRIGNPSVYREALRKCMEQTAREAVAKERNIPTSSVGIPGNPPGTIYGRPGDSTNRFEPSPGHETPLRRR